MRFCKSILHYGHTLIVLHPHVQGLASMCAKSCINMCNTPYLAALILISSFRNLRVIVDKPARRFRGSFQAASWQVGLFTFAASPLKLCRQTGRAAPIIPPMWRRLILLPYLLAFSLLFSFLCCRLSISMILDKALDC